MKKKQPKHVESLIAGVGDATPWVRCEMCDDFLCTIHGMHVADCDCPGIDEWETDPYTTTISKELKAQWKRK